jgi:gliding motility-associated-like protein
VYTPDNCFGLDTINIRVFQTGPDIFVPNAFTPGKGTNGLFRPIPVGILEIDYFRVYNRWGELMFNGSGETLGWDGNYNGKPQGPGGYVWIVQGKDFTGKVINRKGTMILIR